MITDMDSPVLSQFSQILEARMGLYFPEERQQDLERKMRNVSKEFAFSDVTECVKWLMASPLTHEQIKRLASHLTVGETYFLREKSTWEALREEILPPLISARWESGQRLRFWSAACCTGEEPYSIAMILNQLLPNAQSWHNTILATDINPHFLQRAAEGVYGKWSFRGVRTEVQERYFRPVKNGSFAILPSLKEQVEFVQLNLVEDAYPSLTTNTNGMDVIFCRNILIYFTEERAKRVIDHLYRALVDGGWLIVSPVEVPYVSGSAFVPVKFPGITVFRKGEHHPRSQVGFPKLALLPTPAAVVPLPPEPLIPVWVVTPVAVPEQPQQEVIPEAIPAVEPPLSAGQPTLIEEAQALYEHGHYAQATEKLLVLCGADSAAAPSPAVLTLLARAYANQGQLAEACTWCEKASAADKFNPGLHYLQSTILLEQGDLAQARLALTRTLYLDPNFVLAHFALGNLARQQHKQKEANKHFANALALLQECAADDLLPESEGMSARQLTEIMTATMR